MENIILLGQYGQIDDRLKRLRVDTRFERVEPNEEVLKGRDFHLIMMKAITIGMVSIAGFNDEFPESLRVLNQEVFRNLERLFGGPNVKGYAMAL
jgi:hypothetical protein